MSVIITTGTVARTYTQSYDALYANQLSEGNTVIFKNNSLNASNEDVISLYRVSHDEKKGIERHYSSLEDITTRSGGAARVTVKAGLTLTLPVGDKVSQTALIALAKAFVARLSESGVIEKMVMGSLDYNA